MSNKKITDLTELTTPTTDDVFPIVDIATNTTQKVQVGNLPIQTAVTTALATKQATLVSGTNIKTVNSTTLLGSGDIAVQPTLVSGTNIKTLNSVSLLGSGDIVLAATPSGVAGAIQFSNGSAFASDASNLFWDDTNNRLGVGTNAPDTTATFKGGVAGSVGVRVATFEGSLPEILFKDTFDNTGFAIAKYGNLVYFVNTNSSGGYVSYSGVTTRQSQWAFGGGFNPTATVHAKGSGSTSATTSLLVQDSNASEILKLVDSGRLSLGANNYIGSGGEWKCDINFVVNGTIQNGNSGYVQLSKAYAQSGLVAGTTTLNASAILEGSSTTQGFLPPRMTTTQRNNIASPAAGLMIYNTTTAKLNVYTTAWEAITSL